jgi:hypothetical protein
VYIRLYVTQEDGTVLNVKSRSYLQEYHNSYDRLYKDDRIVLSKRGRLSSPVLPSGPLSLTALGYPSSGELYDGPRQSKPIEVFNFKDNKLGTTAVSMKNQVPAITAEYATEHIIEVSRSFCILRPITFTDFNSQLQTLGMFMVYTTQKNKTLDAFFRNKFVKRFSGPMTVANRPSPPNYKLGTNPARDSLTLLVFEAMGSTNNPSDFVLCESAMNTYKMLIWSLKDPMGVKVSDQALADSMVGAVPSSDFLSALRLVRPLAL